MTEGDPDLMSKHENSVLTDVPESTIRQSRGTLVVSAVALVLFMAGAATTDAFLTGSNMLTIVRLASMTGIVAIGMTFITMSGYFFSLSAQQTAAFSAIAYAAMTGWGWPLWIAILGTLAFASVIGLLQGALVASGANPIITTLGAGAALFGAAAWLTDNRTIRVGSTSLEYIGRGRPLGVPTQSWAFIVLAIVGTVVLSRTRFGRHVALIGANPAAAVASGIRKGRIAAAVFTLSSFMAGLAGIFLAAQIGQGVVNQFETMNIDSIAAVLIGGTAVQGGDGSMTRTVVGALFVALLINLMLLRGFSFGERIFFEGVAVTLGVSFYTVLKRRSL